jgi:CRISPR-associated protein Cas10/Csm1 subtype III-A
MNNEFNEYREKLKQAFTDIKEEKLTGYLIKGDISGIQEFIFNVPSRGAARLLKARSFFLQTLVKLCIKKIDSILGVKIICDSGGSFYLLLDNKPDQKQWNDIQVEINTSIIQYGLYISLTWAKIENWGHTNKEIIINEEKQKYQRFNNTPNVFNAENPIDFDNDVETWKAFAKKLANAKGYSIKKINENGISENGLAFLSSPKIWLQVKH